jgi:hypothetical protein
MSVKQIHEEISKHNLTLHQQMALVQLIMGCEWDVNKSGKVVLSPGYVDDPYDPNGVSLDEVDMEAQG